MLEWNKGFGEVYKTQGCSSLVGCESNFKTSRKT